MQYGKRYTILFSAAVCGVFAILVTGSAVLLKDRQDENFRLDRVRNVLEVAGLTTPGQKPTRQQMLESFDKNIETRLIDLKTGETVEGIDPGTYDQRAAAADKNGSFPAPANPAGVTRIPKIGLVYIMKSTERSTDDKAMRGVLLPVEGKGLWSTLYGYLALDADLNTILGITFYQHGETPGLGGEVDNPRWKSSFRNKQIYGTDGRVAFRVTKGSAGNDRHKVDAISGATITSNGVTNMIRFWMGENGYGPFLERLKAKSLSDTDRK